MKKVIRITCTGAGALEIDDLVPLQGTLKSLSTEDYQKLRKLILELGFTHPVAVWKSGGKFYMLDGHQRVGVIRKMVAEEGFACPPLPVVHVDAENLTEAKRKLLAMSSQFGRIEGDGLYNFLQDIHFEAPEILTDFRLADFSARDFLDEFFVDPAPVRDGSPYGPADGSPSAEPFTGGSRPLEASPAAPVDKVSNTKNYRNETQALENFLASDVRRITIYMNPNDYDSAVARMAAIADRLALKDYRDVLFVLLSHYETTKHG